MGLNKILLLETMGDRVVAISAIVTIQQNWIDPKFDEKRNEATATRSKRFELRERLRDGAGCGHLITVQRHHLFPLGMIPYIEGTVVNEVIIAVVIN